MKTIGPEFSGWLLAGVIVIPALAGLMTACAPSAPRPARALDGAYVPVPRLARFYDLSSSSDRESGVTLANEHMQLHLQEESRQARIDGVTVWLHQPVVRHRRRLMVAEVDVHTVLDPLLRPARALRTARFQRVILDAGHGGTDPGGRGATGLLEKDVTLKVTHFVAARLAAAGVDVVLTRAGDQTVTLDERLHIAHARQGDVLVSIHFNAAANPHARGAETFVLAAGNQPGTAQTSAPSFPDAFPANAFDGPNQILGFFIQRELLRATGTEDRGQRRARFRLLRDAPAPAALIEGGFLTHAEEEQLLADPSYQDRLADGIARGILNYLGQVESARE